MGSELRVGDIMTKRVIVIPLGSPIIDVARLMKKHKCGSIVIVDSKNGNKAKGIITERDIVWKIIALKKDPYKTKVDEIMSKPLKVVRPETAIEEAAKAMKENSIKRLPVVNEKKELVGIISEGDIMRVFPAVVDMLEEKVALKNSLP
jgi:CBS domain-containing protein